MDAVKHFDNRAKTYGRWFGKSLGAKYLDELEKETLLEILKPLKRKGINIAEVGPGRGRIAGFLIENMSPDAYYGIELAPKMAKELKRQNLKGMKVIKADGSSHQLKKKVEAIISIRQIKYSQDYQKQLKSMRQSLKKGGTIVIEFPSVFSVAGIRKLILGGDDVLLNPFKLKKQLNKMGVKNQKTIALRYLPDNFYLGADGKSLLSLLISAEKLLIFLLPYWLGRSIFLSAKAS